MPGGAGRQLDGREDGRRCLLELVDSWTAERDGRRWLLELVETAGRAERDGRRWLLELVETAGREVTTRRKGETAGKSHGRLRTEKGRQLGE